MKPIYCCNCGKQGHIYKKCKEPITSFGIIAFKFEDGMDEMLKTIWETHRNDSHINKILNKAIETNIKILLIRRKDTLGYVEFVRGKYNIERFKMLMRTFNIMTLAELEKIKISTFDELWNDLWMIKDKSELTNDLKKYTKEYESAKYKFMQLKEGVTDSDGRMISLDMLLGNCKRLYHEQEWGLPKGRKNIKETFMECAEREFIEETGINPNDYEVLRRLKPLEEIFIGTNNVNYKHIYYIAKCQSGCQAIFDPNNKTQCVEISDIRWFNYNEAVKVIRPYNTEKKIIIKNAVKVIKRYLLRKIKSYIVLK